MNMFAAAPKTKPAEPAFAPALISCEMRDGAMVVKIPEQGNRDSPEELSLIVHALKDHATKTGTSYALVLDVRGVEAFGINDLRPVFTAQDKHRGARLPVTFVGAEGKVLEVLNSTLTSRVVGIITPDKAQEFIDSFPQSGVASALQSQLFTAIAKTLLEVDARPTTTACFRSTIENPSRGDVVNQAVQDDTLVLTPKPKSIPKRSSINERFIDAIKSATDAVIRGNLSSLTLDCCNIKEPLSVDAIGTLITAQHALKSSGAKVRLKNVDVQLASQLEMMNLGQFFDYSQKRAA